jgi:hypothetical protein
MPLTVTANTIAVFGQIATFWEIIIKKTLSVILTLYISGCCDG